MGWASGSRLMREVIKAVKPEVPEEEARYRILGKIAKAFDNHDWDTWGEATGIDPAFDRLFDEKYPPDPVDMEDWIEDGEPADQIRNEIAKGVRLGSIKPRNRDKLLALLDKRERAAPPSS